MSVAGVAKQAQHYRPGRPLGSPDAIEAEFAAFCERNLSRVRNFLRGQCRDPEIVEDALQETFLAAREAWPKIREYDEPMGWVYNAARYKLRKQLERARRDLSIEDVPAEQIVQPSDAREAQETLVGLLSRLPVRQAQVFFLATEGFAENQIAGILGIARNTVHAYRYQARHALQQLLAGERPQTSAGE
ncbi:RNA polymerase sigma factor [Rugosimonospora africana]|uniref:HTH luxR-type domain-containing protein n=1 Tax=Rugosimonospora africana TaxID=556532 RepID=A0A8J3QMZ0_9ACTN|nr:sigma-70 family RNA polymerase sigma factor [Rugosimonospora africana]GIH12457.1 hypothetical protein Raf01_06290 [Rugosimonospora africana]